MTTDRNTLRIVIAGGSGFLGRALVAHWAKEGHDLTVLSRGQGPSRHGEKQLSWDGRTLGAWAAEIDGCDLLINLAGRSVDCRYTSKNKADIMNSRIESTAVLWQAVTEASKAPRVWMNASTATIYRHAQDRPMTEVEGEIGDDFSMGVAKAWEAAFFAQEPRGMRQIALRTSIVMGEEGGAFPVLSRLTSLGLGGRQGDGRQMVSWIHLTDFCRAVDHLFEREELDGVVNVTAPHPLTNQSFTEILCRQMGVWIGLPHPRFLLELGAAVIRTETELVLKSRWVLPERLTQSGFKWRYGHWQEAVEELL